MSETDEKHVPMSVRRLQLDEHEVQRVQVAFGDVLREQSSLLARDFNVEALKLERTSITAEKLRERVEGLSNLFQVGQQTTFDVRISSDWQLVSPPYDVSWQVGAGWPFSASDGKSYIFGGDGFSAAGFGINLTSDRYVLAAVVPQGQFKGGWGNLGPASQMRASGGTGTVVYCDGALLLSRQPRIWDVNNPSQYTGANFEFPFASTQTPPQVGSFGSVPLAPVLFEMLPGRRYLVWFYIWQAGTSTAGKPFLAFGSASIPLVTISTGPPLFIH